jgi:hypothetical protein
MRPLHKSIHPSKRPFIDFLLFSKSPNVHDLCQFLKLQKIEKWPFYLGKATYAEVSYIERHHLTPVIATSS